LADHIARGGAAVALEAPMVTRLLELAEDAEREQPERAALWCAAALRRLTPGGPEHARTLTRLLDLVLRTGRYELLRDALTQYAEQGSGEAEQGRARSSSAEIRLAAFLVALHSGEPPAEEAVRSLLDEGVTGREPIGFAEWWFGRPAGPGGVPGAGGSVGSAGPAGLAAPAAPADPAVPADPAGGRELFPADRMELLTTALSGDPAACER
ncbi:hypothetical protein GTY57_19200, partial [Streptomyces sp. SID5475]|nr:hypothetical protein [Streptomyces sp. SID5475]